MSKLSEFGTMAIVSLQVMHYTYLLLAHVSKDPLQPSTIENLHRNLSVFQKYRGRV